MKNSNSDSFISIRPHLEVGVDVAKHNLQIHADGSQQSIPNTERDIRAYLRQLIQEHQILRVTCEATGGYENNLIRTCLRMGIPISLANPLHVKFFARSLGTRAKTDPIDAKLISRFARERNPATVTEQWHVTQQLRDYYRLLSRLNRHRTALLAEIDKYSDSVIKRDIRQEIKSTEKRILKYRQAIDKVVASNQDLLKRRSIMEAVIGVGRHTSNTLLAVMPELGTMDRRRVASLAGLAPHPRDSGQHQGKRVIVAGRKSVRTALYMASLSAVRLNPDFRGHYKHLRSRGKSGRCALIAIARKLLIHLNTLLKPTFSTI